MMRRRILAPTALAPAALALALAALPAVAAAQMDDRHDRPMNPETRGIAIVADLIFARPLGLVATAGGSVLYLVALPFAALSGDYTTPAEALVGEPARYTFTRPLGDVDSLF